MSREDDYKAQLQALEIYDPAFAPAIHDLCVTEREYSRAMKAWRAAAQAENRPALSSDPLYGAVLQLRRDIQTQRTALGLTPVGLQKLRGRPKEAGGVAGEAMSRKLDAIWEHMLSYDAQEAAP